MNITVATACSIPYLPLAAITDPTKIKYAQKHGYRISRFAHHNESRIAWERVELWKIWLNNCDWLFFTGCDAMITNPEIKLESLIDDKFDFIFSCDAYGLQSDSWIMKNCPDTRALLDRASQWEGKIANEQEAMMLELAQELIEPNFKHGWPEKQRDGGFPASRYLTVFLSSVLNRSPVRCKIVGQTKLNAYPYEHYQQVSCLDYGEHSWHPGAFVLHMPGKSLEYRLEHMKGYLK